MACLTGKAQSNDSFFQLPTIPDSLSLLQDRTDYMVEHYWDYCVIDKAFSSRDKMAEAFDTYISFMPYASRDAVYSSVANFMERVGKKAENALFIGELAEEKLYTPGSELQSDELFLIFAEQIIKNKKIDKNSKLRYQHLVNTLTQSAVGSLVPTFNYTDVKGGKHKFEVDTAKIGTILFFNDPNCDECQMARLRLDTDIMTRQLVEGKKMVDIVCIYPSDATDEWREAAEKYPSAWTVGASEQVNDMFDLRTSPTFYVINPNGAILMKTDAVDNIIGIMAGINNTLNNRNSNK